MSGKHRQLPLVTMDAWRLEKGASPDLNEGVIRRMLPEFTTNESFFSPAVESCLRSGLAVLHCRGRRRLCTPGFEHEYPSFQASFASKGDASRAHWS
jgi:hypothetical protein